MKHVTRKQLLNRAWGAAELDAAAEFWLRLYEASASAQGFTAQPDHITEVRLRGFPRAEGSLLADELARRAALSDFRRPIVELRDPDTLVLTSELTHPAEAPPVGLGLPLLAGPGFDGLMVELRVTAVGGQGQLLTRTHLSFTLVLVGQVIGGVFVLQALWRTGSSEWEDDVCWYSQWPEEAQWLAAFDRYRDTSEVPVGLSKAVCVPRGADRFGSLVVKLVHVPLDKPRFAALAWRWLLFSASTAGIAAIVWWLLGQELWLAIIALASLTWWVFVVFLQFILNEARLWFGGYKLFHAMYSTLYRDPHRLGPLSPEIAALVANNPAVGKYTADLQAAGFVHAGDVMTEPQSFGESMFRVFRAPDGVTHLTLLFGFASSASSPDKVMRTWPANVSFVAHTHFAHGGYAVSVNGRSNGYRRKRSGPEAQVRVFPDETDPLEFVRRHVKSATAFAEANGYRPLPNTNFAEYVRRQDAMREDDQRYFVGSPYTWGDHLRWYLQVPRRVFRE